MKKILLLLFVLVLGVFLVACGTNKTDGDAKTNNDDSSLSENKEAGKTVKAEEFVLDSILEGKADEDIIWSKQSEEVKKAIIDEANIQGYDADFNADGSLVLKDKESGAIVIQDSNGTWTVTDKDGNQLKTGEKWPDNEFSKQVPKPDFKIETALVTDTGMTVRFGTGFSIDTAMDYAKKAKAAGFSKVSVDLEASGTYSFMASNNKGYSLIVTYTPVDFFISVNKK